MELLNGTENRIKGLNKNVWGYYIMSSEEEIIAKIKAEKKYTSDPPEDIKSFISEYNKLFYDCNLFMKEVSKVSKPWIRSLEFKDFPTLELTTPVFDEFYKKYEELPRSDSDNDKEWYSYCKKMRNIIFNAKNIKELIDGYFTGTPEKKAEAINFIENPENLNYKKNFPVLTNLKGGKPKKSRRRKNKKRRSSRRKN